MTTADAAGQAAVDAAASEGQKGGSWKSIAAAAAGAGGTAVCGPLCGAVAAKLTDVVTHAQWVNHQADQYIKANADMNAELEAVGVQPAGIVAAEEYWRHHTPNNPWVKAGVAAEAPDFFSVDGAGLLRVAPAAVSYYQDHDFPRDGMSRSVDAGSEATFALMLFCLEALPYLAQLALDGGFAAPRAGEGFHVPDAGGSSGGGAVGVAIGLGILAWLL